MRLLYQARPLRLQVRSSNPKKSRSHHRLLQRSSHDSMQLPTRRCAGATSPLWRPCSNAPAMRKISLPACVLPSCSIVARACKKTQPERVSCTHARVQEGCSKRVINWAIDPIHFLRASVTSRNVRCRRVGFLRALSDFVVARTKTSRFSMEKRNARAGMVPPRRGSEDSPFLSCIFPRRPL
jgi:hypothetical protein